MDPLRVAEEELRVEAAAGLAEAGERAPREEAPPATLRANRDFRILLVGQGVSAIGDAVSFTALPLLVYALTGSGLAMGTMGALQTLPDLLFGLPAGALADRWDRRRMMLVADLGRGLLTFAIPLSVVLGLPTLDVVYAVVAPISILRVAFMAAWTASTPQLVGAALIGPASSSFEAVYSVGFAAGPALAGLLAGVIGPAATLAVDAVSFLVSAASLAFVRRRLRADAAATPGTLGRHILDGLRFVGSRRALRAAIVFWGLLSVVNAPIVVAMTIFLERDRALGPAALGFVLSAFSVGSLVGALLGTRLTRGALGPLMLGGTAVTGLLVVLIPALGSLALVVGLAGLAGTAQELVLVSYVTVRATLTPNDLLGRVGSMARLISVGLQPVGMIVGGLLLDASSGGTTLRAIGALLLAIAVAFASSRTFRELRADPAPGPA